MKVLFAIFVAVCLSACDASIGKLTNIGSSAHVTCYSGGEVIYDGYSTGKVASEEHSDGYFFKDKKTKQFVEVSGNCIIRYE